MRRPEGYLYLLTLTAPGAKAHALPNGDLCPCTGPDGTDLAVWNTAHSKAWNHFRTLLRREYPSVQFFRGVEVQRRGALHDHSMTHADEQLDLALIRRLAIRAGFGHSVDLAPCVPGSRKAAYYVSKYVTKATDSRDDVPWLGERVDLKTGEVTVGLVPGRYRTWSMSHEWGDTMSTVRARACAYARTVQAYRDELRHIEAVQLLADALGATILPAHDPPP
jgi:hypothetical protein